jgi:serine/threonine-protein kinase HipA
MALKAEVYLFGEHIATIYQEEDRVYFKQIDLKAYKASPISLSNSIEEIETTALVHLEKVPGFISDSLPGNFGNEILNTFFKEKNDGNLPTVIDKLLFIGDSGLGALTFKPQQEKDPLDIQTLKLKELFDNAKELRKGKGYHSIHSAFLVSAHSFVGGARAKAVVAINIETKEVYLGDRNKKLPDGFISAIVKYDDTQEDDENKSTYSKLEYVYYLLAKECGIEMSNCYLVESHSKYHFVTQRFDIDANAKRYHIHSLAGLLHLDYSIPRETDYRDLFRTALRLNATSSLKQLFRQMLFNYLFVNQDDHSRNFSFMCDEKYKWVATPAYDVTFAQGEKQTVEHQLSLNAKALSKASIEDVIEVAREFSIYKNDEQIIEDILHIKDVRDAKLETLMKEYKVPNKKYIQVINAVKQRNFQGVLDV